MSLSGMATQQGTLARINTRLNPKAVLSSQFDDKDYSTVVIYGRAGRYCQKCDHDMFFKLSSINIYLTIIIMLNLQTPKQTRRLIMVKYMYSLSDTRHSTEPTNQMALC